MIGSFERRYIRISFLRKAKPLMNHRCWRARRGYESPRLVRRNRTRWCSDVENTRTTPNLFFKLMFTFCKRIVTDPLKCITFRFIRTSFSPGAKTLVDKRLFSYELPQVCNTRHSHTWDISSTTLPAHQSPWYVTWVKHITPPTKLNTHRLSHTRAKT